MGKTTDMSDFPDIINTAIIDSSEDQLWADISAKVSGMQALDILVVSQPFAQGSPEEVQLQKMMQACKLEAAAYNTIHIATEERLSWARLRDRLEPKYILLLGVLPQQLGIAALFHMFAPNRFNDRVWIAAPSLAALEQQPEAKKQLWLSGLKPVFVDKANG